MPASHLLRHHLGDASELLDDPRSADLDFDPPPEILQALADRTGIDLGVMRMTTIAGWMPWLAGTLEPYDGQEAFDSYVRQDSVLLAPGEAGRNTVPHWVPWIRAHGQEWRTEARVCPACMASGNPGASLIAALPVMTTCGEHGLRLQTEVAVRLAALDPDPEPFPPALGPVIAMDRLMWEGLASGRVTLPGRAVHVGVWFRLLRTLLDEVSMAASQVSSRSAAALAEVWAATGRAPRGGLTVWRPYERLHPPLQQAMIEAAAAALRMAATGEITARGTLARCLAPEPHRDVYEGDREEWERRQAEAELRARCQQQVALARRDPAAARQLLAMFTAGCSTYASFYRERRFLVTSAGIPDELLPDHVALGRTDLRL
jgi:hypothetical protein